MADSTTTVTLTGPGGPISFLAGADGNGNFVLQSVPRVNSAPVAPGNPMPVADAIADPGIGTPADAAWSGTGNSSVIAALKAIWSKLAGTLTVGLVAGTNNIGTVNEAVTALAYTSVATASVGTTTGTLVPAGQFARSLTITTLPASTANVWLNPMGAAAVVGSGVFVAAGGGSFTFGTLSAPMPTLAITAITDGASAQSVAILGG